MVEKMVALKSGIFARSAKMLENDHFLPGADSLNLGTSHVKSKHTEYGDSKINSLDSFSCITHPL